MRQGRSDGTGFSWQEPWEAEDARLRGALDALGRRYGVFWLVLTVAIIAAFHWYEPPRGFRRLFEGGLLCWGAAFVALPAFRWIMTLCRLREERCGGADRSLLAHRFTAGMNLVLSLYCLAALVLGWGRSAVLPLLPLVSLANCFGAARNES